MTKAYLPDPAPSRPRRGLCHRFGRVGRNPRAKSAVSTRYPTVSANSLRNEGVGNHPPGVLIIPEQQESIPHRAMDCQTYCLLRVYALDHYPVE
jgi:hypothetical protein